MKAVSKIIVLLLMGCVAFSLFSCKFASIVNFESEDFEQFKANPISIDEYPDTFYYVRVMTAFQVQLIFRKFSKENDFSETIFQNISIFDDKGIELYKKEQVSLPSDDIRHSENGCNYEIYAYQIERSEFDPNVLANYMTEYIILAFEIDGKKYSEKLKRVETRYWVTRT